MKKILLGLSLMAASQLTIGQTIAPNITSTDINGNAHNLYQDYISQGKPVVIDFSTTWCGPCWGLHQTHVLRDLYNVFGPNGTNQLMVLFIESDSTTTLADLNGTTQNAYGNWVEGTPYPIIDSNGSQIATDYGIQGFPTLYYVCPDSTLQENLYPDAISFQAMAETVLGCAAAPTGNNAIAYDPQNDQVACGSLNANFLLINNSATNLTSKEIKVYRNGTLVNTQNWTGNLAPNGMTRVELENLSIDPATDTSNFKIMLASDDNNNDNETTFQVAKDNTQYVRTFTVTVTANEYASEDNSNFKVFNSQGVVVDSSGVLPATEFTKTITLPEDGCYKIQFFDEYGDGFYGDDSPQGGSVSIVDADNTVIFATDSFTDFSVYTVAYNAAGAATSIQDQISESFDISVTPNVTSSNARLNINNPQAGTFQVYIYNSIGQKVATIYNNELAAGNHALPINLNKVSAGQYYIHINTPKGITTKRIIKK